MTEQITAPLEKVTRRRIMKMALWGTAGAAAVAAGAFALLKRSPLDGRPKPENLTNLSQAEYLLFERAMPVLLPVSEAGLTPLSEVPVLENINHLISLVTPAVRKDIATALSLFDNAAVLIHGKRFVDLDDQQALAYFENWSTGNMLQRALGVVVKKFVYVGYWQSPETWKPLNYDGPVSVKWGIPDRGNEPLPPEDITQMTVQQEGV